MAIWSLETGYFDRGLMFEDCQSQCRCYLVPLSCNEIVMVPVNTKIKYHKLVDLLLYIYIYICSRNMKSNRKGGKNCSYV